MDTTEKLLGVLFWILFVVTIIITIWYLVGHSPTIEQFLVAWLSLLTTQLFKMQHELGKHSVAIENVDRKLDGIKAILEQK